MDHQLEASEIQAFILDTLGLAGATTRWVDGRLLEAFVPVTRPPSFFGAEQPPYDRLLLAFGDDPRGLPPEAELVTTGSYRLGWFIDGVRKRGKLSYAWVPHSVSPSQIDRVVRSHWPRRVDSLSLSNMALKHEPHLLANFHAQIRSDEPHEEVVSVSSRLDGSTEVEENLLRRLSGWNVQDCRYEVEKKMLKRLGEAFQNLVRYVLAKAEEHWPTWREASFPAYEDDMARLKAFYSDGHAGANVDEITLRADELREKHRPRLAVSWVNAAVVLLPAVTFEYEAVEFGSSRRGRGSLNPVLDSLAVPAEESGNGPPN